MDRIDIHVEVPAVRYKDLTSQQEAETSADIRERMNRARTIQSERLKRIARTIADLEQAPDIAVHHVSEAIQYRSLDRNNLFAWGTSG